MSMLTAEEVTNLFLYGKKSTPSDLTADSIVDHSAGTATVDLNDYMTNGPGRFASPALFDIV